MTTGCCFRKRAFTLIEILVVVAIIAMLVAILLPSLARARAQSRMIVCQTNVRQLAQAFNTYGAENVGRFPGMRGDDYADWLGGWNAFDSGGAPVGRQPEDGTLYRKYLGAQKFVYNCPDDRVPRNYLPEDAWFYSYTGNLLLAGSRWDRLVGAHYRAPTARNDPMGYHVTDHTANMRPFNGVPIIIEEDPDNWLVDVDDSGWCNVDCVTDRHLKIGSQRGYGNIGYTDGHVRRMHLTPSESAAPGEHYFVANAMCIRTLGGKWVSGLSWGERSGMYAYMDEAVPAEDKGVRHAGP